MEDGACNKLAELALNDVQACSHLNATSYLQMPLCITCP